MSEMRITRAIKGKTRLDRIRNKKLRGRIVEDRILRKMEKLVLSMGEDQEEAGLMR